MRLDEKRPPDLPPQAAVLMPRPAAQHKGVAVQVMYESLCQVMRGGYSKWVAEIHRRRTPQCRNLRRSRVYRVRFG